MKIVLGIGNPICDLTAHVVEGVAEELGLRKGDQAHADQDAFIKFLERVEATSQTAGGSIANSIVALSRLGMPARFAGGLGNDRYGKFYSETLAEAGVEDACARVEDVVTGSCLCLITPDGERTMATCLGAASFLDLSHIGRDLFEDVGCVYLSGYLAGHGNLLEGICELARAHGAKIAFDAGAPGMIEGFRQVFEKVIPLVDILFVNEDEAAALTEKEPEEALSVLSEGREVTAVKTGGEGSLVACGGKTYRISVFPAEVVDTTGAGDTYAAGFLYKYLTGANAEEAGVFASRLAAKVVSKVGARFSAEEWVDILRELRP
ncbi:MAG: adenosine kinase [Planctomycetota bacterium]|jgi:sugar/nucleoside kinase (ribokinase family)